MTVSVRNYNRARNQVARAQQSSPHRAHDLIRSGIRTGLLAGDALIEEALMLSLSSSRNAVRQALQMLAAEGLVDRRPNHGTTVIAAISDVAHDQVVPANALQPTTTVREIEHRQIPSTSYIKERLQVRDGLIDMSETLISVNGEPRSLRISYIPAGVEPIVRVTDAVPVSEAFQTVFGIPMGASAASIGAVAAGPSASRLLGIAEGAPIIVEEMLLSDVHGVPREFSYTHHRADRVSLSVNQPLHPVGISENPS